MNSVPYFRITVRAIGEHVNPQKTAYHYQMMEFNPNGTFRRVPALHLKHTRTRRDDVRLFEEQIAGLWTLVDVARLRECLKLWNRAKFCK